MNAETLKYLSCSKMWEKAMTDGLYRVVTRYLCAGFVIQKGSIKVCAPILRRKIDYWKTVAIRIGN